MKHGREVSIRRMLSILLFAVLLMAGSAMVHADKAKAVKVPFTLSRSYVRMGKSSSLSIPINNGTGKEKFKVTTTDSSIVKAKVQKRKLVLKSKKSGVAVVTVKAGSISRTCYIYVYNSVAEDRYLSSLLSGKRLSVMGDSISSHKLSGAGTAYYTDNKKASHYLSYDAQYWKIIMNIYGMTMGYNSSIAGNKISGVSAGIPMARQDRINQLNNNGTPDLIFFYGGTNDINHRSEKVPLPLGTFSAYSEYVTKPIEEITNKNTYPDFVSAYVTAIRRMKATYPKATIIAILPNCAKSGNYVAEMKKVCQYYKVRYIDLKGLTYKSSDKFNTLHPNAKGFRKLAAYILKNLYATR